MAENDNLEEFEVFMDTTADDIIDDTRDDAPDTPEDDDEVIQGDNDSVDTNNDDTNVSATDDDDESDEVLSTTFSILKDKGFLALPEDYEFTPTEEGWDEMLRTNFENMQALAVQSLFEEMPEEGKMLLNYYLEGGRDIDTFVKIQREGDFPETIDEDDVETKRNLVAAYYKKTTKFSDDKIKRSIRDLEMEGKLDEELTDAQDYFKTYKTEELRRQAEADKQAEVARKQQVTEAVKTLTDTIKGNKEIYGVPFVEKDAAMVVNSLFSPVRLKDGTTTTSFNLKYQEAMNDPKKVALLVKLLESDFDLTPIKRKKETEATNSVKEKLKMALDNRKSGSVKPRSRDDFDIESAQIY